MSYLRLQIESGDDDVEREYRKLNKLTAMKVNGELLEGKLINGELGKQRQKTEDTETEFYKKKDRIVQLQQQLVCDYMVGSEHSKIGLYKLQ